MSREKVTIAIEAKIDNLKAGIEASKKIIEDVTNSTIKLNSDLRNAQAGVTKAQKEYAVEITATKAKIEELLKIKAENGKLDKEQRESLAGQNAQLKIYKDKVKELVAVEKEKVTTISQTILANKEQISLQKQSVLNIQDEIASKKKVIDLENKYAKEVKITSDQLIDRIIKNKEMMNQQKTLTTQEKELLFAEQKKQYAEKEAQTAGKVTLAQLKEKLLLNKEISKISTPASKAQKDTFAKEQYTTYAKDLAAQEKLSKTALDETTKTIEKKTAATSNLANETIRYLRWAGTIAGVVYAGKRAWDATLGSGIEVNKIIESNTYGIAALVSANTMMIDSLGNTLTPLQKFQMGQEHAKKAIEEIRKESVKTAATFPQLLEIFQQGIGKTLSLGSAFGETTEAIEKNTIKLSSRMSNFANAIGMPMDRVREEMRSLVSGNASTDSLISTIIFGSPTEANKAVKEASGKVNGLTDLFEKKFKPFDILADTQTFEKSVLSIQDSWSRAMGDMVEKSGMFKDITNLFYDMSKEITYNSEGLVKTFDEVYEKAKTIAGALDEIAVAGVAIYATSKIVTGVSAFAANMAQVDVATGAATSSIRRLTLATTTFLKANAPLLAISAAIAAISYDTNKMDRYVDNMASKYADMYQKQVNASKGTETDLKLIREYSDLVASTYNRLTTSTTLTDSEKGILTAQTKELEKQLETLGKRVNISKEERESVAKTLVQAKEVGKLQANFSIDAEAEKKAQEDIEKSKGKIYELDKEKVTFNKELAKIQSYIATQEKQYATASGANQESLKISIDDLKSKEKLWVDRIALADKEIADEKDKTAVKSQKNAEVAFKSAVELNREYAAQEAIRKEISMYESGQVDEERIKISLQEVKIAGLAKEYELLDSKQDKEKVLLELYRESANYTKMVTDEQTKQLAIKEKQIEQQNKMLVKKITGEFSRSVDSDTTLAQAETFAELAKGQLIDVQGTESQMQKFDETIRNTLDKIKDDYFDKPFKLNIELDTSNLSEGSEAYGKISKSITKSGEEQKEWNKRVVQYEGIIQSTSVKEEDKAKAKAEFAKEETAHLDNQIVGYSNLAGVMSGLFDEGSKEAAAFQAAQASLALVTGVRAVLASLADGDPYTAIPRAIAVGAMVSSLLSNIGVAFGMNTTTTTSDAYSSMVANDGSGSVLGDIEAQSESITNAMSTLEDFAEPQYQLLSSMNKYLANISNNIGGVTSLLVQSGGFAFGEGATEYSTGYKNNISLSSDLQTAGEIAYALLAANPISLATAAIDKLFLGGAISDLIGGAINSVLGGLFGKTSVSQSLTDSGLYFADTLLSVATEEIMGQAYQTISTTTSKKSWFSKSSSTSVNTYFDALDAETNRQFSLVLSNIYDTVVLAGGALDKSSTELESEIDKFVVSIGKISLKDKTGDEIQESLTAIFGKVADDIVKASFPLLTGFQSVGEGMFETLTRVATGMEEAEYYISRLGVAFDDISYTDIINQQGDVGFEALLQSIIKTDEALYGLDNNLVNIIGNLDSTAEELYAAYDALDGLRGRIKFLGQDIQGLSSSMLYGAGSLDALQSGFESYFEGFLTEEEQLAYQTEDIQKELSKLNISMPITKTAFTSLLNSIDLTTESGQELYGRLISISEAFGEVADSVEESIAALEESLQTELDAFSDILIGVASISTAFQDTITSISDTIDTLLGNKTGANTQDNEIAAYWNKKAQVEALVAKGSNLNSEESDKLKTLTAELGTLSTNLQSGYSDNTNITDNLVSSLSDLDARLDFSDQILQVAIVDGLGELLGLNVEQASQLKEAIKDGKLTNEELGSISNLTETQKTGILEFANNSKMFATEATLSNLETWSKLQLESYQNSIAKETESLSKSSFTYGDYIGKQEQIDIAKTLGVSYDTAQPLVSQLQSLSVSKNINSDVASILGYTQGGTTYDTVKAGQIAQLGGYLDSNITKAVGSISSQASLNLVEQQKAAAFASAKTNFESRYSIASSKYQKEIGESNAAKTAYLNVPYTYLRAGYKPTSEENISKGIALDRGINGKDVFMYPIAWQRQYDSTGTAYRKEFNEAYSAYQSMQPLLKEKALKGYSSGGYTGLGSKYEPKGIVHADEYVIKSEDLNAIGGESAIRQMVQREIVSRKTNSKNISTLDNSNNNNGIIDTMKQNQNILASGFNAMLKMLDELVDYNNERREQGHLTKVTGSIVLAG